ncbi:alpha/beta family hydrolase [Lysobacter korlensis]|uniref:Alpha/beta family hydrolase n=1 Tax=Lysobacter korlensis TaxID=553636 RepID=A0ABV6S0B6_9GAMM
MERLLETSLGPARITVSAADEPRAVLWLGHGAGGGIDSRDLLAVAKALPAEGITVVRHEQPWRLAGRKVAVRPPMLDIGWLESAPTVLELANGVPLFVGGRSAGARVGCRTAGALGAAAVVCLGFPLHPPGKPEKSRLEELLTPDVPVLVVQGEHDTFGSAAQVRRETEGETSIRVVEVPKADHGLRVAARSGVDVNDIVTSAVRQFVDEVLAG